MVMEKLIDYFSFNQYRLRQAINKFGAKGEKVVYEEMEQLHKRQTFKPIDPRSVNKNIYDKALESLIFIKGKDDGRLKGRACADGRKQQKSSEKDEATSYTACLESIFLTGVIEAKEEREVAVADIPNIFVQTSMEG